MPHRPYSSMYRVSCGGFTSIKHHLHSTADTALTGAFHQSCSVPGSTVPGGKVPLFTSFPFAEARHFQRTCKYVLNEAFVPFIWCTRTSKPFYFSSFSLSPVDQRTQSCLFSSWTLDRPVSPGSLSLRPSLESRPVLFCSLPGLSQILYQSSPPVLSIPGPVSPVADTHLIDAVRSPLGSE